jgi:hypothetical protein
MTIAYDRNRLTSVYGTSSVRHASRTTSRAFDRCGRAMLGKRWCSTW